MPHTLPPQALARIDESDDTLFYSFPRLVVHIDDGAIRTVGEIFAQCLPKAARLLDLMSSWRSHLPATLEPAAVVGLGLNRTEMEDNPALTQVVVHDLNRDPRLPFDERSFDGAILTVSVQYLTKPIELFADTGRVLREGAPFIVSFSNRMFPTKAIQAWRQATEPQRVELVKWYFDESDRFDNLESIDRSGNGPFADPIYAVIGRRRS